MTMAKAKKGKGTQAGNAARTGGGAGSRQDDMAGASGGGEAGSMQSDSGSMQSDSGSMGGAPGGDLGSRQSALPDAELPIQSGGERIGVGQHRQGRQTGGLHQPSIADELAAESAPDQGKRK
jgi:hypothetical protein